MACSRALNWPRPSAPISIRRPLAHSVQDGAAVKANDVAFTMTGPAREHTHRGAHRAELHAAHERHRHTLTRKFVEAIDGTGCRVLDTRKTTPPCAPSRSGPCASAEGTTIAMACTTW